MSTYLDACLRAKHREYPAGYGFALAYLSDAMSPEVLAALRDTAFYSVEREAKRGNEDAARFVQAYVEGSQSGKGGWTYWLIEAAQLVHAAALNDDGLAILVMSKAGHPGFLD